MSDDKKVSATATAGFSLLTILILLGFLNLIVPNGTMTTITVGQFLFAVFWTVMLDIIIIVVIVIIFVIFAFLSN